MSATVMAVGAKNEEEEKEMNDGYQGSRVVNVGPTIIIGCISNRARELLDELVKKFEATYGEDSVHDKSAYSGLYWAVRWSGLIQPYIPMEGGKKDPPRSVMRYAHRNET